LIELAAPNPFATLGPVDYLGGSSSGASFNLSVPFKPGLIGLDLFAQGLLVTPAQNFSGGLTNGLQIELGAPQFPGLVAIQAGTFQMGSNAGAGAPYLGQSNEKPVHPVTISYGFWMGATEVTQGEYQALMGTNPSSAWGATRPVERVSWFEAQAYCAALTAQQAALGNLPAGYHYRLPTEAEWEYACRAGTTTEFNVGADLFCNQARFGYSLHSNSSCNDPSGTAPVGSYAPNAWGLFDMDGNVREWCLDTYAGYPAGAVTDPFVKGATYRVIRGGSWTHFSNTCRSANRYFSTPFHVNNADGFRVVLAPILVP
jgi:formylglycine-generating enzyme required for sulfatase activity